MNRTSSIFARLALSLLSSSLLGLALAHELRVVGAEGGTQYEIVVGMLNEPVFTEVRTGLDLTIRSVAEGRPVEGLETSLEVTVTAPGGQTRTLQVRPRYGAPGAYTDDYILTTPGTYDIRVRGFIGDLEVDETFPREVADGHDLRFP